MNTDYLRIVEFWSQDTPDKKVKGIFHKWVEKQGNTLAIIEVFYKGTIVFIESPYIRFLDFHETSALWHEEKNRVLL